MLTGHKKAVFHGWNLVAFIGGIFLLLVGGSIAVPATMRLIWDALSHILPIALGFALMAVGVFLVRFANRP